MKKEKADRQRYLITTGGKGEQETETNVGSVILGALDALSFYVMLIDANHHILLANKAVTRDLGVDPQRIAGGYCPRVVHGLDSPFPGCPLEEAVTKGQAVEREFFDPKFGRWIRAAVYPTGRHTKEEQAIFLHFVYDISKEKQTKDELQRNYDTQNALNSLLNLSLEDVPFEELLRRTLDLILSIPWLTLESRGGIFLVEDEPKVLVMKAQNKLAEPIQKACARVPFGRCLCGRAALTQQIQFADRVDERHETRYESIIPHGHYCVPILFAGKTLGVINTYLKEGHGSEQREKEFLTAVANTLAGILVRKQAAEQLKHSFERLRRTFDGTANALASVVERRDPYTAGHQRRVTELAVAIAAEMGLPKEQIEGIRVSGILHDVGKMYVPAEMLSKPGRLTEIEFSVIKTHPQVSYDILKTIEFPWPVAQIAFQHHERLDGSGYPSGLSGKDILLEARILAVADVVEAMSSHRPYRPTLGTDKALFEILQKKGVLYDPEVVDACLSVITEKGFKFEQQ